MKKSASALAAAPHDDERLFLVAAAQQPARAERHPGIDDVVNPGACDTRPHVCGIALEDRVERPPRLPILVPAGLAAKQPQLQPDGMRIELAQEEQHGFIGLVYLKSCAREGLAARGIVEEGRQQVRRTGRTP